MHLDSRLLTGVTPTTRPARASHIIERSEIHSYPSAREAKPAATTDCTLSQAKTANHWHGTRPDSGRGWAATSRPPDKSEFSRARPDKPNDELGFPSPGSPNAPTAARTEKTPRDPLSF